MTPREIANLQLIAYNNRDLDAFCELFEDSAQMIDLPSMRVIADGIDEIRSFYQKRFAVNELHCRVHSTSDIGNFAVDRETVSGIVDGPVDILAIYEVISSKIQRVHFIRQQGGTN